MDAYFTASDSRPNAGCWAAYINPVDRDGGKHSDTYCTVTSVENGFWGGGGGDCVSEQNNKTHTRLTSGFLTEEINGMYVMCSPFS